MYITQIPPNLFIATLNGRPCLFKIFVLLSCIRLESQPPSYPYDT